MESRAKLLGHAGHQMLIPFPLGLLTAGVVADIVYLVNDGPFWANMAYWLIAAGVIMGLVAAVFGAVDYISIPRGTRAKYIGTLHGVGNVVMIALFGASWALRQPTPAAPPLTAILFAVLAVLLSLGTAWLGGELVDRLGVGIDDGANVNAPSSLSGRSAREVRAYHGPERRMRAAPAYAGAERRVSMQH